MNYKEADLPDDTYKMLRKKFGEFTKDGIPNTPGVPPRDLKKITPVLSAKKMKTFKQFSEMAEKKINKKITKLGKKTGDYKPLDYIPNPLFLPPGAGPEKKI